MIEQIEQLAHWLWEHGCQLAPVNFTGYVPTKIRNCQAQEVMELVLSIERQPGSLVTMTD